MSTEKRILIVDDDLSIRLTFRYAFFGGDWRVETASTGEEALDLMEQEDYRLVFLDYRLPGMDGLEVLHRLEADKMSVPIVMISAELSDEAARWVRKRPFVADVLTKPVSPGDLRKVATDIVQERGD